MQSVLVNGLLEQNVFGESKVVETDAVYDATQGKAQSTINAEVKEQLEELSQSTGSSTSSSGTTTVKVGLSTGEVLDENDNEEGLQVSSSVTVNGAYAAKDVTIPVASERQMGVMSAVDKEKLNMLSTNIFQLGIFASSMSAEDKAALPEYAGDTNVIFMYYSVVAESGNRHGLIYQQINELVSTQIVFIDGNVRKREITFTDKTWTTVETVGDWVDANATSTEQGLMSAADKAKLDGIEENANNYVLPVAKDTAIGGVRVLPATGIALKDEGVLWATPANSLFPGTMSTEHYDKLEALPTNEELQEMINGSNFQIKYLGYVGTTSAAGETAAADIDIVGNENIKWVLYTYSSYNAAIHQTHEETSTIQDMFFGSVRHSRRTITFTDNTRTTIASVGSWSSIGNDIGVNRTSTTATIKMVNPLMEKTAGEMSLVIGQANASYAGLMTAEQYTQIDTLATNYELLQEQLTTMDETVKNLQSKVEGMEETIENMDKRYIRVKTLILDAGIAAINIPLTNSSSTGGTISEYMSQVINLSAIDENDEAVDISSCEISWAFKFTNDEEVFSVEHEVEKSYVTFYADEGEMWYGNTDSTLTITATDRVNKVTGSAVITLHRQSS